MHSSLAPHLHEECLDVIDLLKTCHEQVQFEILYNLIIFFENLKNILQFFISLSAYQQIIDNNGLMDRIESSCSN